MKIKFKEKTKRKEKLIKKTLLVLEDEGNLHIMAPSIMAKI